VSRSGRGNAEGEGKRISAFYEKKKGKNFSEGKGKKQVLFAQKRRLSRALWRGGEIISESHSAPRRGITNKECAGEGGKVNP